MILQGHFTSLDFQYVEVKIKGCDQDLLTEEEGECAEISELDNLNINLIGVQSFIDFHEVNIDDVVNYQKTLQAFITLDVS